MIEWLEVQPNARSQLSFPAAGDVLRSHRRTQAEPDESASDDEADALSELSFLAQECHSLRTFEEFSIGT